MYNTDKMKAILLLLLILLQPALAKCDKSPDSLLVVLKSEILKKTNYDREKELYLKKLKESLAAAPKINFPLQYSILDQLIEAYRSYNFDSAHVYTYRLIGVSAALKDPQKRYQSKIKLGALQLSWGMYKEAFDCIGQINAKLLSDSNKLRYYEFKARALNELAAYNTSRFYSPTNRSESIKTLDSAINLTMPGSYDKEKYLGQLYSITNQHDRAVAVLEQLFKKDGLTIHQRAMVANDLSYLVSDIEKENLLKIAAIFDIRTSTKQTLAIFRLGTRLLKRGELDDAEFLLNEAMAEAHFFGNIIQERNIGISQTELTAEKLIRSEKGKIDLLVGLISVVTLGLIGIAIGFYIVFKLLNKVKIREALVKEKYEQLDQINKRLLEDGYIKEEYIGYFFHQISSYISILEKLKRNIEHKLKIKSYEELMQMAKEINIKKERENLFYTFDTIFLKLFPNFIDAFNELLKPEGQVWPKRGEVLNVNLRIFALMRLGIGASQTIANILETTLSTVYTYKNRVKSKALFHGDEFDKKIMAIKFVGVKAAKQEAIQSDQHF
jgi:DNA-binding CsgD family transcriptional regulator